MPTYTRTDTLSPTLIYIHIFYDCVHTHSYKHSCTNMNMH